MNEITRIHIAKVAYDVEVAAKKQLEKYIKSLESYTADSEVLSDIEIRITELLAERGVAAGGVIATEDIAAIREQLGEPHEFAEEDGDIAVGGSLSNGGRKLFRSTDTALLGGVLSGIATYFNVNPLWTRLIFALLAIVSFGTAFIAYIVLWIVLPPARTAADKLQQEGRSVTLGSIRELNESESTVLPSRAAAVTKQILSISLGTISLLSAIAVLGVVVFGVGVVLGYGDASQWLGYIGGSSDDMWATWVVFWIVLAGLMLLATLFALISYAFFARKLTKKMVVSGIVITVLGVASFAATVGIATTEAWRVSTEAQRLSQQTKINLPKEFAAVTGLVLEDNTGDETQVTHYGSYDIRYVVHEGTPRYELEGLPSNKVAVTVDGETAKITLRKSNDRRNSFVPLSLTVYGPALTSLTNNTVGVVGYSAISQDKLDLHTQSGASTTVDGGSIERLSVGGAGSVDVTSSSVVSLVVNAEGAINVSAGTVRELSLVVPDACPSNSGYTRNTTVQVAGVTSESIVYNGARKAAESYRTNCVEITINDPDYSFEYYIINK